MPFFRASGGGGGSGITLGPVQNTFGSATTVTTDSDYAANKAAAETLRNTYATANAAWLTEYNDDLANLILLVWTGGAYVYQRRNAAGNAWEDVTNVAQGTMGNPGTPRTGPEVVTLLQALTGNARLNATAIRLIAGAIDTELGSTDWRTGGMGGGSDTAAQILTKLLTVDGAGSGLDADLLDGMTPAQIAALGGGSDTAAQILVKLLTVDGTGSGLDADLLDGVELAALARLTGATFTGAVEIGSTSGGPLSVNGQNAGNDTIMKIFTPDSGTQKAFGAGRDGEFDWVQFAGEVVTGKPGFALGPGTARDTNLYREEADHLRTDDEFSADELSVHGTLSDTQTNLGILTQAEVDGRAAVRYTDGEKSKLAGIEGAATADQTGAEIVSLLEALVGSGRLSGSAVKLLADAIDTELGNNTWRTGGGTGFTLRAGPGIPDNSLGDNDDWYLRTSNGQWYEKASGSYVSQYTDQVGQMGSGLTQDQVDARVQTALAAAVTGNTETGITVTYNADGTIDFVAGETVAHDLIVGWSDDTSISDTELAAGATPQGGTIDAVTIPVSSGNRYLFVWRADADGGDPTEVHIAGGGNQRNIFGTTAARTYSGTAGQLIVSVVTQNAGLLGGEILRVV